LAFPLLATVVAAEPKLINHVKQNITRLISQCYFCFLETLEAIISCSCRSYLITVHRRSIASSPSFQNKWLTGCESSSPESSAEMSNVKRQGSRFVS
jgi:hypothetical protein